MPVDPAALGAEYLTKRFDEAVWEHLSGALHSAFGDEDKAQEVVDSLVTRLLVEVGAL